MRKRLSPISLLPVILLVTNLSAQVHKSALLQYDKQIDGTISQMTIDEKIDMLHAKFMFVSAGVERLGIADMRYADGPFGIREEMQPNSWSPLGWPNDKATFFPTGSALAATWSPELAYKYGTGLAREAKLRGKDMLLGPAINIQRIPTGGRTYEYLSEDPYLSSVMAASYVKGVQDNGVAACVKHYALNNQENNRGSVDVIIGERAMHEIYLAPFRAAVEDADAYGIMPAYNKVNGAYCSENDYLLNTVLRNEWGFSGMTVSDWGGTHSTVNSVKNGLNVEMPSKQYHGQALLEAVKNGQVSEEIINQRVREILRVRLAIKPVPENEANKVMTSQPEQQKIAYEVACKSIVLLKNDGILPIVLDKKPVIAVIGANATQIMATGGLGAGVKTLYEVTPLEGLKNRIGDKAEIIYAKGYDPSTTGGGNPRMKRTPEEIEKQNSERAAAAQKLTQEAVEIAAKADLVLYIGGDNRTVETEGTDRKDIMLPYGQDELLKKISAVNPKIVTVLVSGGPNDLNTVTPLSRAMIISWFNGTEGGNALADVLTGKISPAGRLPFTIPVKLEDSPAYALGNYPQGTKSADIFANLVAKTDSASKTGQATQQKIDPNKAYYSEESLVGYRWFDTKNKPVMYPFGYGLAYTTFSYSGIKTDKQSYGPDGTIKVSFKIKNTGKAEAEEVPQVYVHRINPKVDWPAKELKAFSRITLKPGETRSITLSVPVKNLRYWNEIRHDWDNDLCRIEVQIGASAGNIFLTKEIQLK